MEEIYMKTLKNPNKMLFRIAKKSGSCHKLMNIKMVKAMASKKRSYYSSNSSRSESDSDSYLYIDSDWEEYRQPT